MTSCGVVGLQRSECGVNKCGEALRSFLLVLTGHAGRVAPISPTSYLLRVELRVLKIAISSL